MIKDLIKDLAYDKITLTQGLTRAKIISSKIDNQTFTAWLKKELEGYEEEDASLPSYRRLYCVVKGVVVDFYGRNQETIPISFEAWGKDFVELMNIHKFTQNISSLETNYSTLTSEKALFEFLPEQVKIIEDPAKIATEHRRRLIKAGREVPKIQLKDIIDLTKQKLLDTLISLDKEFPNLENDFIMNDDNDKKIKNIITTNIYGGTNPMNIAAGDKVEQKDNVTNISTVNYSELEKLGVEKNDIEELKTIVSSTTDKPTLKSKVMKWLGSVSATVAGRGLYDNIPAITEFVDKLI